MANPENGEHDALGQELMLGVGFLIADALLRSGLPLDDTTYSAVEFNRDHTRDEEIDLEINTSVQDEYKITLSERPRILDHKGESDTFDMGSVIGLVMEEDGSRLRFKDERDTGGMTLAEAATHIIRRLPDFNGSAALITVQTEVEVKEAE